MTKRCLERKMVFLAALFLLFTGIHSYAQLNPAVGSSPWRYANPSPHGYTMQDMSFIDDNTGLAVGTNGGIARTTDGGLSWASLPFKFINSSNTVAIASFNDVQFVTPGIAYAVGNGGLMIKSTDGGLNWTTVSTPLKAFGKNIMGLHFLNKDTGYIGGQPITSGNTTNINDAPKIYFTRNGGATWDSLATPFVPSQNNVTLNWNNQKEIHRIYFVNDSVGYACGSSGNNFSGGQSALLWKIEKGVITDYCLHRTKFGATTGNHTPSVQTYKGLLAVNDSLVLMSSFNNNVVLRVKTGKNDSTANAAPAIYGNYSKGAYEIVVWLASTATPFPASLASGVAGQMHHLKKAPGGKIVMSAGNSIVVTPDNGTTWTYTKPTPGTLNYAHWSFFALDVTPNGRIITGGFNGLTYESLPGSPWNTSYNNVRPLFYSFTDMDWADCNNGIIVGSNGTIIKTIDGGRTWVDNSSAVFEAAQISLVNVVYHNVNSMFFTAGTTIYKSADQGTTNDALFTEPSPNSGGLASFTMVGPDRAFAVGYRFNPSVERTLIFRSLNANAASPVWDTVKTFPQGSLAPQLRNIKFANQDTGYVSGNRGKIYRTINGGATWTDISPDTTAPGNSTANYTGLSVVNGKTIYVGGSSRKLFKSTDAGATWIDLTLAMPSNPAVLSSFTSIGNIVMNDVNNGYIQAGNILLKTNDGWATWTYDLSPQAMQNISLYPKISGPMQNKKLYALPLTFGFPGPISTQTASLLEYGDATLFTVSSTENITNASCTNPTGGSITVNATGGIAPYTYSVDGGAFQSSNVFNNLAQGAKTITIKDNACGTITKTVTVGFSDDLVLTTSNDTIVCAGAPVQLMATSTATTYSWSPASGLSNAAISNPVAAVNNNTAFTVTASLNGCVKTKTVNISIKPNPVISAGPDKTILVGDQTGLQGSGAITPQSISWTPAASIISGAAGYSPVVKPATTTTYTLTVKDANSCTSTDDVVVAVIPYCAKVMDAFTPNGDGINDKWLASNGQACFIQMTVAVFNRYGGEVYKNNNYQNDWDGTYKGKPVADGTYYYIVTYKLINGRPVTLKGDVTILR